MTNANFYNIPAEVAAEAEANARRTPGYKENQVKLAREAMLREWWVGSEDRRWSEDDMKGMSFTPMDGGVLVEDAESTISVLFKDGVDVSSDKE